MRYLPIYSTAQCLVFVVQVAEAWRGGATPQEGHRAVK